MTSKKQEELYIVKRNIRYHNPDHPLSEQIVTPDMPEAQAGLPFPHLSSPEKKLLVRRRVLAPKPKGKSGAGE